MGVASYANAASTSRKAEHAKTARATMRLAMASIGVRRHTIDPFRMRPGHSLAPNASSF